MLYIDPGAGTLLLQSIVAVAVGAFFTFRNAITRTCQRVFGRRPPEQ